jgi:hypothetical protein
MITQSRPLYKITTIMSPILSPYLLNLIHNIELPKMLNSCIRYSHCNFFLEIYELTNLIFISISEHFFLRIFTYLYD